jgi:AraC family transcriptional regulator
MLGTGGFLVTHQWSRGAEREPGRATVRQDAFMAIVQLRTFASHTLWRNNKRVFSGKHPPAALAITSLEDVWRCDRRSSFDNVRVLMPRTALDALAEESGWKRLDGLNNPAGAPDRVAYHLAKTLALAEHNGLVKEHAVLSLVMHLVETHSNVGQFKPRGGLSRRQETCAKEMLASVGSRDVSIATIAAACHMSRGHFIRAFKQSTGTTPHRWRTAHFIAQAQVMLRSNVAIANIAIACGFADQSHFTRVFSTVVGVSPATWRASVSR